MEDATPSIEPATLSGPLMSPTASNNFQQPSKIIRRKPRLVLIINILQSFYHE